MINELQSKRLQPIAQQTALGAHEKWQGKRKWMWTGLDAGRRFAPQNL